jgi:signal transduction histidine kinase
MPSKPAAARVMSSGAEAKAPRASLERSLQWTLGVLVLAVLLSLIAVGTWVLRQGLEQFAAARLAHDAEALIVGIPAKGLEIEHPLPPVYSQPFSGHYYQVRMSDGRILRSRSLWDYPLEAADLMPGETRLDLRKGPLGQRLLLWQAGYERRGDRFTIAVAEDLNPLLRALERFLSLGIGLSLLGALILLSVQRWLLRRAFRQIDAVRTDLQRLTTGEITHLREDVPAEIHPLVGETNLLIAAWRAHLERSRAALGNLAHALKSPLALILHLAGAEAGEAVREQAMRMHALIERELKRARLAGGGAPARRFQPRGDSADLVATLNALYAEKQLNIATDIRTPEYLAFDQEDMLELLGNLLDNAAKWAKGDVRLTIEADDALKILVEDDGPGVEPAMAKTLLSRGGRLDETTPGHGLGLSIVGDIVRLHEGELHFARSEPLGGLAVALALPIPRAGR